ncbi:nudix hydrolase 2 isoform X1 [Prunus dulcis]|uniref:nudix hydrolase 2 isoform X1 n=1 Tax=Prunus dulcis TaxID=3755 RepID=UPI0014833534|nr:nudix hydrolase 2 isoform X1 [Prunus dulcis]
MAGESETSVSTESEAKRLVGTNDPYGGVIVHINEPMDPATFLSLITSSIAHWKLQGKKGVWIKLPLDRVNLVEAAVKEGFWYHHAEPDYLMLVYWIPQTPHTLPANATHRVGIGAFVINPDREVLVVQEKSGLLRGTGVWKFPTGVVDEGEDICAAAVREVKEETGVSRYYAMQLHFINLNEYSFFMFLDFLWFQIDSEFVEILAFRQSHKSFFEKSDLFFVCMMQPLSFDIQKHDQEIEAAQWMAFEEYAAQPFVQKNELLNYINDICKAKIDGHYSGFSPVPTMSFSDQKMSYLYLNGKATERDSRG